MESTKETAQAGRKLELASQTLAARDLGPWMCRVVEFMRLKPKEQAARIVQVRCPNPDVTSFHEKTADAVYKTIKEINGGTNGNANKHLSVQDDERYLAERIWKIAVEGVVDDAALGYSVFGYTVAPTRDLITDPRYFRFMTSRNQTFFHSKSLVRRDLFRAERSGQTRVRHTLQASGAVSYDFPAFDPRFIIQRWLNDIPSDALSATTTAEAVPEKETSVETAAVVVAPTAPKARARARPNKTNVAPAPAPAPAPLGRALTTAEVLTAKGMRVHAASLLLPGLIATKAVEVLDERQFGLADTQRFGFFPTDFAVDVAGLLAAEAPALVSWSTWPLTAAIMVAANPDRFAPQGLHRFLASHSSQGINAPALRTDTQARVLDSYARNSVANTWDIANLATEVYISCKALDALDEADSVVFTKARTLFVVAECIDRVLRVARDATVPGPGRVCAFSGEMLAPGTTRVTTIDIQLRVFPDVSESPMFVRLWVAPTVRHWRLTDAPAKKKTAGKRPRPDAESDTTAPTAAARETPPARKKARKEPPPVLPALPAPRSVVGRVAEWPQVQVKCDPLWFAMCASLPPQDPALVAAVRALLALDKKQLRKWVDSDTPSNFVVYDVVHRFLQAVPKPSAATLLGLGSDDDGGDSGDSSDSNSTIVVAVPHAHTVSATTLTSIMNIGKMERSLPEPCRGDAAAPYFEKRIVTPEDLKKLDRAAYEWTVFAALFDGAKESPPRPV